MQFFRRLHPVRAVSFDLDDTLYDNVPVMLRAEQAVRDFMAKEFPQTAVWQAQDWLRHRQQIMQANSDLASNMTQLRLTALTEALRHFQVPEHELPAAAQAGFEHFMQHRNAVDIAAQTHQCLSQLAERLPLFALSNGNVDVHEIGLGSYFTAIFQPSEQLRGKPFGDMFAAAQAVLPDLAAQHWLHVGDSASADVLGAHRAGWQSAWFTRGLGRTEHLQVLPTMAYSQLPELTQLLLQRSR